MKRTMILCVSILLLLSLGFSFLPQHVGQAQETGEIVLDYSFETPTAGSGFQEPYELITLPGTAHYARPGKPVMPMKTAKILIPYGREVEDIQVIPGYKSYLGKFYVQPGQEPIPIGDGEEREPTPPDPLIYDSTKPFPEKLFSKVGVQWKRGYQILIVNLFPVEYVPKSREVSYYQALRLAVKTRESEVSGERLLRRLPQDRELISNTVDNPEQLQTYLQVPTLAHSSPVFYDGQLAYDYASEYWDEVCSDGYFWDSPSTYVSLHPGTDVRVMTGCDCAHFVSCCIGSEFHEQGGGLDVPSGVPPTYGEPGAVNLGNWLIDSDNAVEVASIAELEMGDVIIYTWFDGGHHSALYLGNGEVAAHTESHWTPGETLDWQLGGAESYRFIHIVPQYDYVIITGEELKDAAEPNFQTLAEWKNSRGIQTAIVTVEEIYANYSGVDEQEKIRHFIRDAYLNNGVEYVLLGGDADGADVGGESGDNIVPVRGLWAWDYECDPPNVPSDLYYACLDGSYDSNGNGIYGEPDDGPDGEDVDLLAEVYVGRAPVDSAAELSNFVTKTIDYESTTNTYLNEVWMVGEMLAESGGCSVEKAVHQAKVANAKGILNLLRRFRDEAIKQEYVKLYYEYSPDVRGILIQKPELAIEAATLIIKYVPAIEYLMGENGDDITVTDGDVEKVFSFVGSLKHEVNSRREEIGEQRSSELIKLLDEFEEETEQARGKSFSNAFQSSIYSGSGGTPMGGETWGGDYKDEIKDGSSNHGYYTEGFPDTYNKTTLYDRDYSGEDWPKSEIIDIINSNIHIINHMGHSGVTYVMKMYNSDVDGLTNDKHFFGYSQGCYAGSFDNRDAPPPYAGCNYLSSDCVVEHLVVNPTGAFAFIANSRFGYFRKDTTDGPSQYYDRQFWDAIFGEGITNIGRANQDSKEDNIGHISSGVMRFCYYEINLLGDPETQLFVPPSEHDIAVTSVDAPETVEAGVPISIIATVKNRGQSGENDIVVQLLEDDTVTDSATIDNLQSGASAEVGFTWSSDVQGEHTLKVYAVTLPGEENADNNYKERVITVVGTLRVDDDRAQCPTAEFTDIQEAIEAITSKGTVIVFAGSYGSVVINKTINVIGVDMPVIDAAGTGNAVEIQADSVTLRGFKAQNSGNDHNAGIMVKSNNNLVRGNTLVYNQAGIALNDASNNEILGNTLVYNQAGIALNDASNNEILGNTLNANEYGIGIESYSSNNHISFNSMSSNDYGVYGYSSEASSQSAILANTISYNNFVDNTQNGYDDMQNNKWQRNYWSNYTGEDADGDGVGDTPYGIAGEAGAKDDYPAMSPQAVPRVSIDAPGEVAPGSDFTASIDISDVVDLDSSTYDVSFDASVLRLDDVTPGLIDSTTIPVDVFSETSPGKWTIIQNVPSVSRVSGSGALAVLHFHVIGAYSEISQIDITNGLLANNLAEDIPAVWTGDSVHVSEAPTIQLWEGANPIHYTGATTPLPGALTNITDITEVVWQRDASTGGEWWFYLVPLDHGPITQMENGRVYIIVVSEDCEWEFPQ